MSLFETAIIAAITIYALFMGALALEYFTDKRKRGQDADVKEEEREEAEPEDVPERASRPGTGKQSRPGKKKKKPEKEKVSAEKAPEQKPEEDKPPEEWGEKKFE
jgi:hypothetical protein